MEVILREHVDHLGRRGEIVKVADGYARNLPAAAEAGLAVRPKATRSRSSASVPSSTRKETEDRQSAQRVADRIAGLELVIPRRVGETEALYGSVTSADIAEALAAKGFEFDRRKLQLAEADQAYRRFRRADQAAPRRDGDDQGKCGAPKAHRHRRPSEDRRRD